MWLYVSNICRYRDSYTRTAKFSQLRKRAGAHFFTESPSVSSPRQPTNHECDHGLTRYNTEVILTLSGLLVAEG